MNLVEYDFIINIMYILDQKNNWNCMGFCCPGAYLYDIWLKIMKCILIAARTGAYPGFSKGGS